MNTLQNTCPQCGSELQFENGDESCRRCLLKLGLESGTDFSLGDLAETLPHRGQVSPAHDAKPNDELVGLKRYRDLQAIHDWSGGTVYRAFHVGLERFVLLRVLESTADDDARHQFLQRAEKLSRLNHAHTAATFEAGVDHGAAYVAEEWVAGTPVQGFLPRTIRERWAEGFFPNAELIRIMRGAASGMHAIHQAGMTHDRINPDSIVVDNSGFVKLVGLGEASESSDDRFAKPPSVSGVDSQFVTSVEKGKLQTCLTSESIGADMFRLGAVFCFWVTGKLPSELDCNLDYTGLIRKLKLFNSGLRSDVCEVIAGCVAQNRCSADAESAKQHRETDANPYEATAHHEGIRFSSAAEAVNTLDRMSQTSVRRSTWRSRFYSGHLEILCCLFAVGLVFSAVVKRYDNNWVDVPWYWTLGIYLSPLAYTVLLETLLGWTIVRRLFAMRLLDHAGEPAPAWRRFWRAFQKSVLLVLLVTLPSMVVPLLSRFQIPMVATLVVLPIVVLFLPALGMYLPSRWIPSGWTSYDLAAGVTWGETTTAVRKKEVEVGATTLNEERRAPTRVIDQYELYDSLGSGGMGTVVRARDKVLGREVAIKLLSRSLMENPLLLERFQREARLAAKVNHPGVAKIYGNGVWNETPYIAMELVSGSNLQQRIREKGKLSLAVAWDFAVQAAEALRAADRSGVVHRDIKPANLMVNDIGQLKVTDFGVSRRVGLTEDDGGNQATQLHVTDAGTIVGTPAYMAPEQARGQEVDRRCDIYSLGMTMYHMLSGHAPFRSGNAMDMLARQMSEHPKPLLDEVDGMTPEHWHVIERMIAKRPEERYDNYDALLVHLRRHVPNVDRLATPVKRIAAQLSQWVAGYLVFSFVIFFSFLLRLNFELNDFDATTLFGYMMLLAFVFFTGAVIFSTARWGTTLGKRLLGLRIIRTSGRSAGVGRAIVRLIVAYPLIVIYIPRMIYYVIARAPGLPVERHLMMIVLLLQVGLAIASLVMMCVRADRRTLHDLAADTLVIDDRKS